MDDSYRHLTDMAVPLGRRLRRPWFAYAQSALRLQAVPVSLAGWLALVVLIVAPGAIVAKTIGRGSPEQDIFAYVGAYVLALVLLVALIRLRGNRYAAPTEVMRDGGGWLFRAAAAERSSAE